MEKDSLFMPEKRDIEVVFLKCGSITVTKLIFEAIYISHFFSLGTFS